MNPFEPWTTPDKVDRVRSRFLSCPYILNLLEIIWKKLWRTRFLIQNFAFPVSHNRHEVPGTARSGGSGYHSILCRAKGNRNSAAPPWIPLLGSWAGRDKTSQNCQLLNLQITSQYTMWAARVVSEPLIALNLSSVYKLKQPKNVCT